MNSSSPNNFAWLRKHLKFPTSLSSWFFALSLLFSPLNDLSVAEHISYGDVLFVLAIATAFFERIYWRETIPVLRIYIITMVVLLLCYVVNDAFEVDDQLSSFLVIFTMIGLFCQAVLILRISDQEEMKFMVYAWMLGGLISSLFVIGFCHGMFPSHADKYWYWDHRARGLTTHPNRLGLNCFMTLPGILLLIGSSRSLSMKLVGIACIGVTLVALDYSKSRAGMAAAFVLMGFWGLMHFWDQIKVGRIHRNQGAGLLLWFSALLGTALIYAAVTGTVPFLESTLNRLMSGDTVSDGARSHLNQRAWEGFFNNPFFGEGYEWFGVFQPAVAHNIYLQYLNAVGLVGFFTFLAVLIFPLMYPMRKQFLSDNSKFRALNMPLLAGAIALIVWLKPQSGFTNYEGLLVIGLLAYISVWRLYDQN